jgi:hypothetical protein
MVKYYLLVALLLLVGCSSNLGTIPVIGLELPWEDPEEEIEVVHEESESLQDLLDDGWKFHVVDGKLVLVKETPSGLKIKNTFQSLNSD